MCILTKGVNSGASAERGVERGSAAVAGSVESEVGEALTAAGGKSRRE